VSRILVVEDEKSMRDLLAMMLRKESYEVQAAESAILARDILAKGERFDILISDISMPGMTGLELLNYAKKKSPDTEVLMMTAYGTKETAIEALNNGAAWYVEKPFDLEEMKMVAEGINTARSVHQLMIKTGVEMPISEQIFQVLFEEKDPRNAVEELMGRAPRKERHSLS
jgi:DNA-binding NtrC family response regulator